MLKIEKIVLFIIILLMISISLFIISKKMEGQRKIAEYDVCRLEEFERYNRNWGTQCAMLGEGAECSLPFELGESLDRDLEKARDRCLDIYLK